MSIEKFSQSWKVVKTGASLDGRVYKINCIDIPSINLVVKFGLYHDTMISITMSVDGIGDRVICPELGFNPARIMKKSMLVDYLMEFVKDKKNVERLSKTSVLL